MHGHLREELLAAALALSERLGEQPDRYAWTPRPPIGGNRVAALDGAQAPDCRCVDADVAWCPCQAPCT